MKNSEGGIMIDREGHGFRSSGEWSIHYEYRVTDTDLIFEEEYRGPVDGESIRSQVLTGRCRKYPVVSPTEDSYRYIECGEYTVKIDPFMDHVRDMYMRGLKFYPRRLLVDIGREESAERIAEVVSSLIDPEMMAMCHHYIEGDD